MIAFILAGGFGTRCRPLTNNKPKSLLLLNNGTVVDEQIRWLFSCADIEKVVIVSNQKFYDLFLMWRDSHKLKDKIEIINDGVVNENNRRGAVGDLAFAFEKYHETGDALVLGSDNLFEGALESAVNDFKHKDSRYITVAILDLSNTLAMTQPNEIVINNEGFLTYYKEKPIKPKMSDFVSLLYILPENHLLCVAEYLAEGNNPDNAGSFVEWLGNNKHQVRGFRMYGHRFDIGDVKSYLATQKHYASVVVRR